MPDRTEALKTKNTLKTEETRIREDARKGKKTLTGEARRKGADA